MDDKTSIAIIIGLLSSLITLLATKIFDIFISKKQHRYNIEKAFFEKKVSAAEIIVSQLTVLSGAIFHCTLLFERLKAKDYFSDDTEMEQVVDENLEKNIASQLKTADNSVFLIGNSLTLYFDIEEDESLKFRLSRALHNNMGLIGEKLKEVDDAYDDYCKVTGTNKEEDAIQKFIFHHNRYTEQIQIVLDLYNALNNEMSNVVKSIRKEMKKYEVK
jgi:hypothetical protein